MQFSRVRSAVGGSDPDQDVFGSLFGILHKDVEVAVAVKDAGRARELALKGGGCENMSAQYKLPGEFNGKKFGRDLEGVRACILDAVYQAQGKGCSPGFLGVSIGGDRASGYEWAKHQLLRDIDDANPNQELAQLEAKIMQQGNELQIGPMGFGGKTTVLGTKITSSHRLPASFFVTISYMCWAYRRRKMTVKAGGEVIYG